MFYYDKIKEKSITYKQFNYASFANGINTDYDERLLPVKYATSTYNFSYQNGALKTGLGIKELQVCYDYNDRTKTKKIEMPEGVEAVATFCYTKYNDYISAQQDMLIVYGSNCYIYAFMMYNESNSFVKLNVKFSTVPMVTNYHYNGKDCLIFATEEDGMYIWDSYSDIAKIEDAPDITSMCMHYERMYVTVGGDSRSVYFTDDLDPTNWSQSLNEGGFINLMDERGRSNKIVSFNDYLYVFREYGIDKIIAYADQTDFQVIPLFTSSTKIYPNTVKVCGDRIMFLANDGIYYFSGLSTTKYNLNINTLFNESYNDKAVSTYYNGKYYLACNLKIDDDIIECENGEYSNNVLIELDIRSGDVNLLRGYDIVNLQTLNNNIQSKLVVCVMDNGVYKLGELTTEGYVFNSVTKKVWKSPKTSFGIMKQEKLLKSITLASDTNIKVVVRYDNKSKCFSVKGASNPITIYPNIKGKEFAIDFICFNEKANISNPQVVVGFL